MHTYGPNAYIYGICDMHKPWVVYVSKEEKCRVAFTSTYVRFTSEKASVDHLGGMKPKCER
jgi:hypothetical protein